MFRTTFYFFILFTSLYLNAQENLIVNGSFEEYTSCPTGNDLGDGQFQKCVGWWYSNPSGIGSPDYFNRCATSIVGVPNNFWGYQEAYDGDGYVGLGLCEWWRNNNDIFLREVLQTKTKKKLEICTKYTIQFKCSLANKSQYKFPKIGVIFSEDSLYHLNMNEFQENYHDPVYLDISAIDSTEWFKVSADFLANGNERYITIGYFNQNLDLDTSQNIPLNQNAPTSIAYYLIDDFQIIEHEAQTDCHIDIPNTFTPNNDGINDLLNFESFIDNYNLEILNRWGNIVYNSTNGCHFWDGTSQNGIPCSTGVYFYQIKNKKTYKNIKSGFIHLFR